MLLASANFGASLCEVDQNPATTIRSSYYDESTTSWLEGAILPPTAAETSKPALCMFSYQLILPGRDMMQHDFFCPKLCDKAWLGVTRESQADIAAFCLFSRCQGGTICGFTKAGKPGLPPADEFNVEISPTLSEAGKSPVPKAQCRSGRGFNKCPSVQR